MNIIQPYTVGQGDYGSQLNFVIVDGNGDPINLTGASLTLSVQAAADPTGTNITISGNPIAVDDAAAGECHYTVANGDFPNPGKYLAQITIAVSGLSSITAPGIVIQVIPSLPRANN